MIEKLVNLARYPVDSPDSIEAREFVKRCREEYVNTGLCSLPDFLLPGAVSELAAEAASLQKYAYFCSSSHNAYLTEQNGELPKQDVHNRQQQTFVGSVAYDDIPRQAKLRALYLWDPLKEFIAGVLGKPVLYRFADPLGACSINVFNDGGEHGWHFDESEFTITLMLQAPDSGGLFEYVPQIRGLENERALVADILDGKRDGVETLPFRAGTLLIFGGRQTLHRVTRLAGNTARLVPVLCYCEQPDQVNSAAVRKLFWGRTVERTVAA